MCNPPWAPGTAVSTYDPTITADLNVHHYSQPTLEYRRLLGVQLLRANTITGNVGLSEAFPTGTTLAVTFNNDRVTSNSPFIFLNPEIDTYYQVLFQQQLLAGFGRGPNLRYLRIARNNQKISDQAFELQVITTVTQIADIYWDLVSAYEDEQVKSRSLGFANQNPRHRTPGARPSGHPRHRRHARRGRGRRRARRTSLSRAPPSSSNSCS